MESENPYASPQADPHADSYQFDEEEVVRDGQTLLMYEGAALPQRCISCNQPATHPTRISAVRHYGMWIAMRLGMIAIVLAVVFSIRQFVPPATEPLVLAAAILAVVLITRLLRGGNLAKFRFYTCTKHWVLRYVATAIAWLGVLLILGEVWIEKLFPAAGDLDMIVPFVACILISVVTLRKTHLQIRFLPNRQHPFAFQGFGEEYLDSFRPVDKF